MKQLLCFALLAGLAGCAGTLPQGAVPVENFNLDRYLGTWYEIARLDHSFERGLSRVTAFYALNEDGSVRVVNRGYQEEKEVEGGGGQGQIRRRAEHRAVEGLFFRPFLRRLQHHRSR